MRSLGFSCGYYIKIIKKKINTKNTKIAKIMNNFFKENPKFNSFLIIEKILQ
jgi:hypothetical protein